MIKNFSVKIVKWQIEKELLKEEDRASYEYAYQVMIAKIFNVSIAFLIALVLHSFITVLVLLIAYIPMRTYAGGYHARTNERCMVVSAIIITIVCAVVKYYPSAYILPFNLVSGLISSVIYWAMVPVADANKPLDEKERKRYRLSACIVWAVEILAAVIAFFAGFETVSFTLILSITMVTFMLIVGKKTGERLEHHED